MCSSCVVKLCSKIIKFNASSTNNHNMVMLDPEQQVTNITEYYYYDDESYGLLIDYFEILKLIDGPVIFLYVAPVKFFKMV